MWSMRCENVPVRATRTSVKYNSERGLGPSRPKSWHFLQVASLEVIEAVARGTEGGRISFIHRRCSFCSRLGDFDVAMRRLRHCPNGFRRFCGGKGSAAIAASTAVAEQVDLFIEIRQFRLRLSPSDLCPDCHQLMSLKAVEAAAEVEEYTFQCVNCDCTHTRRFPVGDFPS